MKPLLAYYGDDFTGSTDVMEVLQWAGLRTVLFLAPPTPEQLGRFENLRAFGVAGWSRTMSPAEMNQELPPVFRALQDSGAPLVHYKICSTFDSMPEIGSIGRALEIGCQTFAAPPVPMLVGAPALGRYQTFGNLFARSGLDTDPARLDRHPTMRHHPITPMDESDLRLHLARQTERRIALFDVLKLDEEFTKNSFDALCDNESDAVLFDVLYPSHLPKIGAMIESLTFSANGPHEDERRQVFAVGSSGIEYALTAHWRETERMEALQSHPAGRPSFGPVDQMAVVTGSCSPVNERQISWALKHSFEEVALNPARLIDPGTSEAEIADSIERGLACARRGASVILHSSRGPDDPRIAATRRRYVELGFSELDVKLKNGRTLGPKLGRILKGIVEGHRFRRVGVAGGDTSGYVARELGIEALEAMAPVAPGSPLCRVHATNALNGLEIIFKGGQVGKTDVWGTLLRSAGC